MGNIMKIKNEEKEFREKVVEILKEKNVNLPCPRCSGRNWSIEGFFNQALQSTERQGSVIGGPSILSAVVICKNCGYISQHALGALDLLPKQHKIGGNGD